MGRPRKERLNEIVDLDGSSIFNISVKAPKNKPKEPKPTNLADRITDIKTKSFSEKEMKFLKFSVGYFHSFYYGRDKLGTFESLKEVMDNLIKKNNETIVKEIKNIGITDDEYKSFWSKLV